MARNICDDCNTEVAVVDLTTNLEAGMSEDAMVRGDFKTKRKTWRGEGVRSSV